MGKMSRIAMCAREGIAVIVNAGERNGCVCRREVVRKPATISRGVGNRSSEDYPITQSIRQLPARDSAALSFFRAEARPLDS